MVWNGNAIIKVVAVLEAASLEVFKTIRVTLYVLFLLHYPLLLHTDENTFLVYQ
jgi:hypothetical protein